MENKNSFWNSVVQTFRALFNPSEKIINVRAFEREIYFGVLALLIFYFIIFYFSSPASY